MDLSQCEAWAHGVRRTTWYGELRSLGQSLRAARGCGQLLVVGHPDEEPWHLAAHLDMLARYRDVPELRAALADGARVAAAGRNDTLLVVSEHRLPVHVVERVHRARSHGSAVLGLCVDDPELTSLAHDAVSLELERLELGIPGIIADFEIASHLFGIAAATGPAVRPVVATVNRLRNRTSEAVRRVRGVAL